MDSATLATLHREAAPRRRAAMRLLATSAPRDRLLREIVLPAALDSALLVGLLGLLVVALDRILFQQAVFTEVLPLLAGGLVLAAVRVPLRGRTDGRARALGESVVSRLREDQLGRAMDPAWRLGSGEDSGHLQHRIADNLEAITPFYGRHLPALVTAVIQPLLILVVVFFHDWLAGILLALTAPLIPGFMALVGMGTQVLAERQQTALTRLSGLFRDRLRALSTLRLFRAGEQEARDLEERSEDYRERSMGVLRVAFLSSAILEFFSAVAIAVLAVYVGFSLLGYYEFGPAADIGFFSGMLILVLAPEFFSPLRRLGQTWHDRSAALAAVMALSGEDSEASAFASPAAERSRPDTRQRLEAAARVSGQDLVLRIGDGPRLPVPDLDLEPGEILRVTGNSGSGKSTLAAALTGSLAPVSGSLLINDKPPNAVAPECLGWLGQDPHLLPGSLRFNLAPGTGEAPEEALWEALSRVGLADVVRNTPHGLDTRIGPGRVRLSGGEAQRLALARVMLVQPALLVLDEPTASLDRAAAHAVLEAISPLRGRSSLVLIGHDPELDRISGKRIHLEGAPNVR